MLQFNYFSFNFFQARTGLYLKICAEACQAGVDVLKNGGEIYIDIRYITKIIGRYIVDMNCIGILLFGYLAHP